MCMFGKMGIEFVHAFTRFFPRVMGRKILKLLLLILSGREKSKDILVIMILTKRSYDFLEKSNI